jgi:hypothetical protein
MTSFRPARLIRAAGYGAVWLRRKLRAAQKRAALRALMTLLKARYQVHEQARNVLTFGGRWIATAAGLLLAGLFVLSLPPRQTGRLVRCRSSPALRGPT